MVKQMLKVRDWKAEPLLRFTSTPSAEIWAYLA